MQSPILEIRDNNGNTLIKKDLYSIIQSLAEHLRRATPLDVLLDGIDVEPPPEAKDDS